MLGRVDLDGLDGLDVVVVVVDVDVAGDGLLHDFDATRVVGFVRYGLLKAEERTVSGLR